MGTVQLASDVTFKGRKMILFGTVRTGGALVEVDDWMKLGFEAPAWARLDTRGCAWKDGKQIGSIADIRVVPLVEGGSTVTRRD